MRFKLLLIFGAIYLLVMGVWNTYDYFANPNPTSISVAAFNRQQPSQVWLHFTDALLDFDDSISLQTVLTKADRGIVIPVRDRSAPTAKTSVALYMTTEKAEDLLRQMMDNPGDLKISSEVEGMVMRDFGSEPDKIRKAVQKHASFETPIVLIRYGDKPNGGLVVLIDAAIVLGAAVLVLIWRNSRRQSRLQHLPVSGPPPLPPQTVKSPGAGSDL